MNPLDLLSYASDDSDSSDEKITKQLEPASKDGGIQERLDGSISHHSTKSTSKFEILPIASRHEPDPQTVHTVEKYLELKEISGFDLTEVKS